MFTEVARGRGGAEGFVQPTNQPTYERRISFSKLILFYYLKNINI